MNRSFMIPSDVDTPLASLLTRGIFTVYLVIAITITLIQVNIEYRKTYSAVVEEIYASAQAFQPGVSDAVWNFQRPFLDSIVQGMVSGGVITGVEIDDIYKRLKVKKFNNSNRINAFDVVRRIQLFHNYEDGTRLFIGIMTVYSNHAIVVDRVKVGMILILISSAIKTIGLWLTIRFFADRVLARPLGRFTEKIKSIDILNSTSLLIFDTMPAVGKELNYLQETFSQLAQKAVATKQLMVQKEVAEAANLAKSRFLAAASHDLRQPLHAMNLYLASLSESTQSDSTHRCVQNVIRCAKAMNDMLDALLDISSIDSGAVRPRFSVFPVMALFDRIWTEFEPLTSAKGLTLRTVNCHALVYSDEEIVERILRNLVSNAVRYTEHGQILIGCRWRGGAIRVMVYDTGIGIAPEKQEAIFEEYYQIHNTERNQAKGLGLGLAIVRRLSKLLDISITVRSQPGTGSCFSFELQRIDIEATKEFLPLASTREDQKSFGDVMVLVIDDDSFILEATCRLLELWDCRVITARSGKEAMSHLADTHWIPDMILCDFLLSDGEHGVGVVGQLRASFGRNIPAYIITGDTASEHIEFIHGNGLPILYKPLDRNTLMDVLSTVISPGHEA